MGREQGPRPKQGRESGLHTRSAGILLPVSSLPSPYGIGCFGRAAYDWLDFLHKAGQSFWQILPLGPTGYSNSPYQCLSAFAGNPYFIDLDTLRGEGLLSRADIEGVGWGRDDKRVDYGAVYKGRESVLRKAFSRFVEGAKPREKASFEEFISRSRWLGDYCLYMAIKASNGQRPWTEWEKPLARRQKSAMARAKEALAEDIRYHAFTQYQFERQWRALRGHAESKGIKIIGDIPIYVSLDSADAWANPKLFLFGEDGLPAEAAGCPPDYFSPDGQYWGNPLYDWEEMARTGYKWWIQRLKSSFSLYDVLRIDHFRGLESFFAIPVGAGKSKAAGKAKNGRWMPGPGMGFINTIKKALPEAGIIAEDLGYQTDEVRSLLTASGFPGMKLVQFAFDSRAVDDPCPPYSYIENMVVYPGTHDNDTLEGWRKSAPRDSILAAMEYTGTERESKLPLAMMRLVLQCSANLVVIPMQDWLGLGSTARINTPSTISRNNWSWRLGRDTEYARLAGHIARMAYLYGRSPEREKKRRRNH